MLYSEKDFFFPSEDHTRRLYIHFNNFIISFLYLSLYLALFIYLFGDVVLYLSQVGLELSV